MRSVVFCSFALALIATPAWSKTHPVFKPVKKTGIRTYQNRNVVGQVLFSSKPIPKPSRKPATISELKIPSTVDSIKFYVRFYYPETIGRILKSARNKTRHAGTATEVWIGNDMVWRASGKLSRKELGWNTGGYYFDHTLYGKERIIKALQKLRSGTTTKLTIWKILYFQESKPHPATGRYRFVDEKIYLAMGSINVIKE